MDCDRIRDTIEDILRLRLAVEETVFVGIFRRIAAIEDSAFRIGGGLERLETSQGSQDILELISSLALPHRSARPSSLFSG